MRRALHGQRLDRALVTDYATNSVKASYFYNYDFLDLVVIFFAGNVALVVVLEVV